MAKETLEMEARLTNFISKELKKIQNDLKKTENAAKETKSGFEKFSEEINTRLIKSFISSEAIMAAARKGWELFKRVVSESIKIMIEFESSMLRVKAILRPTEQEFRSLEKTAKQLGATTVFTASESADAFVEMGKRGFEASQIIKASSGVLDLAAATQVEMAAAASATVATLNQFSLEAQEAGRVSDVMALSFNKSALDMFSFTEGMKVAGPVAGTLGEELEDITGILSVLADREIKGSLAGTALRRIMLELADSNSKASKRIEETGKSGDTLIEKLKILSKENISATEATDLFTIRATTAAQVLLKNIDNVDGLSKSYKNATGTAQRMADTMTEGVEGSIKELKSATEGLVLTWKDDLTPVTNDLAKALTEVVRAFSGQDQAQALAQKIQKSETKLLDIWEEREKAQKRINKIRRGELSEQQQNKAEILLEVERAKLKVLEEQEKAYLGIKDPVEEAAKSAKKLRDIFEKQQERKKPVTITKTDEEIEAEEKAAKERARLAKKVADQIFNARKRLSSATIKLIEDDQAREIASVKNRFDNERKAVKGNTEAIKILNEAEQVAINAVDQKFIEKKDEAQQKKVDMIIESEKMLKDTRISIMEEGIDQELALLDQKFITMEEKYAGNESAIANIRKAAGLERAEIDKGYKEKKAERDAEEREVIIANAGKTASALASIAKGVIQTSMKNAKAKKTLLIGLATADAAAASVKGVRTVWNTEGITYYEGIAATIAVLAQIAATTIPQISAIKNAKFAQGGVVPGGNISGDNVPINVNSKEMVLTTEQQAELFNIAKGNSPTTNNNNATLQLNINVPGGSLSPDQTGAITNSVDALNITLQEGLRNNQLGDFVEAFKQELVV